MSTNKSEPKSETVVLDGLVGKFFFETERNRDGESVKLQGVVIRKTEDARYVCEIHSDGELPEEREFCRFDMRNWNFFPTHEKLLEAVRRIR